MIPARTGARAAFAAAAVNLLAASAMLFFLREGLPGSGDLAARAAYVEDNVIAWRVGWLTWNGAAITLLMFYVALASRWWREAPMRAIVAVSVATAGLTADLIGEAILMISSPGAEAATFASNERFAIAMTGFVANGLYTLAGILLTWAGARELPRALVALAACTWTAGLALSAATLIGSTTGQAVATGVVMSLFIVWAMLVGRWLLGRGS